MVALVTGWLSWTLRCRVMSLFPFIFFRSLFIHSFFRSLFIHSEMSQISHAADATCGLTASRFREERPDSLLGPELIATLQAACLLFVPADIHVSVTAWTELEGDHRASSYMSEELPSDHRRVDEALGDEPDLLLVGS